jgi:two-component system, NtrC family, sensor kinase
VIQKIRSLFSQPFQLVLVISFSLIAAISTAIGAWAITQTISDYLSDAMNNRVARDMQLAETFYDLKLREVEGITARMARDPLVIESIPGAAQSQASQQLINQQIINDFSESSLGGNQVVAILNSQGRLLAGQLLSPTQKPQILAPGGNWAGLGIIQQALESGKTISSTEIIPADLLAQVGLYNQSKIAVLDTPRAAPNLYDSREGSAGLTIFSVTPIKSDLGEILGSAIAFHLLNKDYTLVDRIREVAGIDTSTIFFGDLRVSTNVTSEEGKRAIGTRISQEVSDVVLQQGKEYIGTAFVVNENYITRYDPLRDFTGKVIGILYVGAKQASFQALLNSFNQRILLVAFGTILLTIVITTPVSRMITRPLNQLKELVEANRRVADGDMTIRVPVRASGEVGLLTSSFNSMLDTLQNTQDQLVQSEKLASLGQLAAGVAHELNNPLGTILLYSDIVKKELGADSAHQDDLEIILNETKRCKSIVTALLEFARQNQVIAQPTNLNNLILSVIELQIKHCEAISVEVQLKLDPSLPKIQADPNQITQVLVNLIENALDAMPDGGILNICTRNEPRGMVTLEFEDTGIGIPSENQSKLFTPFFTTKPLGKGTGLGLAIIYGIIKMHRGQIMVTSEINKGTKFTLQLPIKLLGSPSVNPITPGEMQNTIG